MKCTLSPRSRFPNRSVMRNDAAGNAGISQTFSKNHDETSYVGAASAASIARDTSENLRVSL